MRISTVTYMETHVNNTPAKKFQKEEKGSTTTNQHPNAHIKVTNTTHTIDLMPSP